MLAAIMTAGAWSDDMVSSSQAKAHRKSWISIQAPSSKALMFVGTQAGWMGLKSAQ